MLIPGCCAQIIKAFKFQRGVDPYLKVPLLFEDDCELATAPLLRCLCPGLTAAWAAGDEYTPTLERDDEEISYPRGNVFLVDEKVCANDFL